MCVVDGLGSQFLAQHTRGKWRIVEDNLDIQRTFGNLAVNSLAYIFLRGYEVCVVAQGLLHHWSGLRLHGHVATEHRCHVGTRLAQRVDELGVIAHLINERSYAAAGGQHTVLWLIDMDMRVNEARPRSPVRAPYT